MGSHSKQEAEPGLEPGRVVPGSVLFAAAHLVDLCGQTWQGHGQLQRSHPASRTLPAGSGCGRGPQRQDPFLVPLPSGLHPDLGVGQPQRPAPPPRRPPTRAPAAPTCSSTRARWARPGSCGSHSAVLPSLSRWHPLGTSWACAWSPAPHGLRGRSHLFPGG